jgi:hypothetical protein
VSELIPQITEASAPSFALPLENYPLVADRSPYVIYIASTNALQEAERKRKRLGERFAQALSPFDGVVEVQVADVGGVVCVTAITTSLDMELDLALQRVLVEIAADWPEIDWSLRTHPA